MATKRGTLATIAGLTACFVLLLGAKTFIPVPHITIETGQATTNAQVADTIKILFALTILSFGPALLVSLTSFTRIIIILSLLRNALGTQQMPPNYVLIGLALFLTFFIMQPTVKEINDSALQPFVREEITYEEALKNAENSLEKFMLPQTRKKDLALFCKMAKIPTDTPVEEIPFYVKVPAFMISELKTGFEIGFVIYLPFLIIDIVVASVLMSMGMLMLPPVMVSLPFKILLFVMIDGWNLLAQAILLSYMR
jgi:flagellar biosynthetic protein FliP